MGQSIEEVLNRLVAVEDAAQQMQDAVDAQKKELAAQMEEKKKQTESEKQFDSMLELKTEQKTEELEANMEHEKAAALEKLREETKKQLAGMQHKYDTEHDRISDEILQSMIKDVSR